ncbi:MAG: hypothetical protein FWE23_05460 [Chitinivibrionia bacterium]|nr:hypothetical protein [Chitinivibrionia bacterium]
METQATRGLADLQAVMAMARQKNPALARTANTTATTTDNRVSSPQKTGSAQKTGQVLRNTSDVSVQSSKLVDLFYSKTEKTQEQTIICLGSRFDAYA